MVVTIEYHIQKISAIFFGYGKFVWQGQRRIAFGFKGNLFFKKEVFAVPVYHHHKGFVGIGVGGAPENICFAVLLYHLYTREGAHQTFKPFFFIKGKVGNLVLGFGVDHGDAVAVFYRQHILTGHQFTIEAVVFVFGIAEGNGGTGRIDDAVIRHNVRCGLVVQGAVVVTYPFGCIVNRLCIGALLGLARKEAYRNS